MTKKKNGFLTFCFSLMPGAGEMYMGFMKQGLSIMTVFFGVIFIASYLYMNQALFILPILWCYSFFHVHNLRGLSDEEFYAVEDDYLFHINSAVQEDKRNKRQNNILAGIFILVGATVLWKNFMSYAQEFIPNWFYWSLINDVPQIVIAVILIGIGIVMIRGKKTALDAEEEKEEIV